MQSNITIDDVIQFLRDRYDFVYEQACKKYQDRQDTHIEDDEPILKELQSLIRIIQRTHKAGCLVFPSASELGYQ